MLEPERHDSALLMANRVKALLDFADQQEDVVLAAEFANVQAIFIERYYSRG